MQSKHLFECAHVEAEAIAFLQFKLRKVEKVTKRQKEKILYLKRKITGYFEMNMKMAKEK
jgi:hypothetical protein